jgi:hypothetical protein
VAHTVPEPQTENCGPEKLHAGNAAHRKTARKKSNAPLKNARQKTCK